MLLIKMNCFLFQKKFFNFSCLASKKQEYLKMLIGNGYFENVVYMKFPLLLNPAQRQGLFIGLLLTVYLVLVFLKNISLVLCLQLGADERLVMEPDVLPNFLCLNILEKEPEMAQKIFLSFLKTFVISFLNCVELKCILILYANLMCPKWSHLRLQSYLPN